MGLRPSESGAVVLPSPQPSPTREGAGYGVGDDFVVEANLDHI